MGRPGTVRDELIGRAVLIEILWKHVVQGHTVLLHGPIGIGKTSILDAIAERAERAGRPCGRAARTVALGDVTAALAAAYPAIASAELSQRRLRGRLRGAVEHRPGILLLDELRDAGAALKGYLRALRGTGLGVLLAGDVEHRRDHAHLRTLGLSYRELAVPPVPARHMARLLGDACARRQLCRPLDEDDQRSLLRAAQGRPGWLLQAVQLLGVPHYFRGDRVRLEILRSDLAMAVTQRLLGGG